MSIGLGDTPGFWVSVARAEGLSLDLAGDGCSYFDELSGNTGGAGWEIAAADALCATAADSGVT